MKKIIIIVFSFILCLLPVFAFADEEETGQDISITSTPVQSDISVVPVSTKTTLLTVSSNDTTGLHSLVLSLIGSYNPIVTDHTYQQGSGYQYHEIDIQPDWSWIMSCAIFIICIYSVFRLFGLALSGVK